MREPRFNQFKGYDRATHALGLQAMQRQARSPRTAEANKPLTLLSNGHQRAADEPSEPVDRRGATRTSQTAVVPGGEFANYPKLHRCTGNPLKQFGH
jgi:hypothetical protein